MTNSKQRLTALLLVCLMGAWAGCLGKKEPRQPVFRGDKPVARQGSARADTSLVAVHARGSKEGPFQHPYTLNPDRMEGLLRSLYFQWRSTLTWKQPERLFTGPEAVVLARRLAEELSRVGPEELVWFSVPTRDGDTKGEVFVKDDYLQVRVLEIQGYSFLHKGTKATSHRWKLTPQQGQGFFPSMAQLWNPKGTTNWIVVRLSDLAALPEQGADRDGPEEESLRQRLNVFP